MVFKSLKAHASRHVLLTLALCSLAPLPALAGAPVFAPATPWEVNAGQISNVRGLKSMNLPCVISTEYDNGYVVRFSGGGNQMLALAIDFRQDVFKQGRQYDTMVTIGGAYVKQVTASAFTSSTLIFNLRPIPDFYNAAQNGGEMEIEIEGNTLKFALNNIGKAYGELEGCYGGNNAAPIKPVNASKAPVAKVESAAVEEARTEDVRKKPAAKAAPKQQQPQQALLPEDVAAQPLPKAVAEKKLPQSFDEIVQNGDEEPLAQPSKLKLAQVTPKAPAAAKEVAAPIAPRAPTPAANPVPAAPEQAAATAVEKDVMPAPAVNAAPGPIISRASDDGMSTTPPPIKSQGVAMASAQPASKDGFMPMVPAPVTAAPLQPVAPQTQPAPQPASQVAPMPITPAVWDAKAGEDMKIVLSRWSERAGYDLQWQSGQDGKVAQDVKLTGSFEEAVGQLLAENSAATGIGAHVETTAGGKKDIGPKTASAPEPGQKAQPVLATIPALHEEWSAAPGANIQSVLDQWSSKAGVAVVWQSYMNVPVKQALQVSGTYEEAVQSLLDQYSGDSRRPVGQLNIDPETGVRTLLVDMSS